VNAHTHSIIATGAFTV